jgi:UDPglucose 6-dehydrogenase
MKIGVVGTGYVGTCARSNLSSEFGLEVTCVDNNKEKIDRLNNGGSSYL